MRRGKTRMTWQDKRDMALVRGSGPWVGSMARVHGLGPWLGSMALFHGSGQWFGSMARGHGWGPLLGSSARVHGSGQWLKSMARVHGCVPECEVSRKKSYVGHTNWNPQVPRMGKPDPVATTPNPPTPRNESCLFSTSRGFLAAPKLEAQGALTPPHATAQ